MSMYEWWCRTLLRAFPTEYRAERAEEMVGVLLDISRPGQRVPSVRTASDLVAAGLRARSQASTHGRASIAMIEGVRLAALVGLLVQAAFSVAMVSHRAHDHLLFYASSNAWSSASLAVLAGIWVVAFLFVVFGWSRLALIPALVGATFSVIILISHIHSSGTGIRASVVLIAVEVALLAVVPTLALVVASTRESPAGVRSLWWVAALVALSALLSVLGTGVRATFNGGIALSFPPSGSLELFLFWACLVALIVMLVASTFDPRLGVAMFVASLPIVVYQVGLLVAVLPRPTRPVMLALAAFVATALVAASSAVSLRRLRA